MLSWFSGDNGVFYELFTWWTTRLLFQQKYIQPADLEILMAQIVCPATFYPFPSTAIFDEDDVDKNYTGPNFISL